MQEVGPIHLAYPLELMEYKVRYAWLGPRVLVATTRTKASNPVDRLNDIPILQYHTGNNSGSLLTPSGMSIDCSSE